MRAMTRRLKRLEARVDTEDPASWPIEKLLLELASCLCSVPVPRLRELLAWHESASGHQAPSDQEALALAISRGEEEAHHAATWTGREALSQGAESVDEIYARVFQEWQCLRQARLATGAAVGRPAPWMFPDRSRWASPTEP